MLAVAALIKAIGKIPVRVVTTSYVRDDPSANVQSLADSIGVDIFYVDPGFGDLGHKGLARYCIGEVKEGMGPVVRCVLHISLGIHLMSDSEKILTTVNAYS